MNARLVGKVVTGVVVTIFALPALFMLQPQLIGAEDAEVVLTGSMKPEIRPGDLVFIQGKAQTGRTPTVGDIIVFKYDMASEAPAVLHRIVEVEHVEGQTYYITKGDNNNVRDLDPITDANIIGYHHFHLPFYGFLVVWSQTKWGLLAFVVAPAAVVLVREVVRLARMDEDGNPKPRNDSSKRTPIPPPNKRPATGAARAGRPAAAPSAALRSAPAPGPHTRRGARAPAPRIIDQQRPVGTPVRPPAGARRAGRAASLPRAIILSDGKSPRRLAPSAPGGGT